MQLKSVFFSRALANRSFRGIHVCAAAAVSVLLLSTALLLASCAHAVNTRGGEVKGSGSSSGSSGGTAGGGSANGTAPGFVVGADAASYSVGTRIDYSSTAGSSGGLGYVTVTPLPSGTLFTERQSGFAVSWTTYSVTVTINGTAFPVSFSAGDTSAVVIENVPVGATLSATAAIGVTSSDTLSYSSLNAATSAASTIQRGSNSITLWVQYPLSCVMSSGPAGQGASVTGTVPAYYTNGSPTTLPAATPSYTDSSLGCAMYFQGWSLEDGGTVAISAGSPHLQGKPYAVCRLRRKCPAHQRDCRQNRADRRRRGCRPYRHADDKQRHTGSDGYRLFQPAVNRPAGTVPVRPVRLHDGSAHCRDDFAGVVRGRHSCVRHRKSRHADAGRQLYAQEQVYVLP